MCEAWVLGVRFSDNEVLLPLPSFKEFCPVLESLVLTTSCLSS